MKSSKLILFLVIVAFLIKGCVLDTFDSRLLIVNKSAEPIFIDFSKFKSFENHPISIDTLKDDTLWNYMSWIPSMDSLNNLPPSGSWEHFINQDCSDSTLTIFLFSKELLKTMPRDSIVVKQLYTDKFTYKVKDLERLNWRIEYK